MRALNVPMRYFSPDRTPAAAATEEEGRLLEEEPPLRRKENISVATTALLDGNLAWGVMYCS